MNASPAPTVIHTRHVLSVQDLALSAGYFREQLGFTRDFVVEGWEFLSLGGFKVMLGECRDAVPASATGDHSYFAHVLVADVDALFEEHRRRGAKFLFPVQDKPWGLRAYGVVTPDGHRICFGQEMRSADGQGRKEEGAKQTAILNAISRESVRVTHGLFHPTIRSSCACPT
jgi:uncharacterized glyoxalase superfamily protein PhnB